MEQTIDTKWLQQRIPLFEKMMREAEERALDEQRYKQHPGYVPKLKVTNG